jgi:hypothetical protein
MIFEANYFITPDRKLLKLPGHQTHGEWIKENYPEHDSRDSLCKEGWMTIATFPDRHVMQTHGMSHSMLRTLQETLCELPRKDIIVVQTAPCTSYELSYTDFAELEIPDQLWRHTDFYGVRSI